MAVEAGKYVDVYRSWQQHLFNFNLAVREAQVDGYFKAIEFHPVREYNLELADQVVADKAVELLRNDRAQGFNHLLMVRARSQKRAVALFELYK